MSANSTVTCLRSPSRVGREARIFSGQVARRRRAALVRAAWWAGGVSRPDQHFAIFAAGQALGVDGFGLEILEVLVVERKASFERPIGHASLVPEEVEDLARTSSNVIRALPDTGHSVADMHQTFLATHRDYGRVGISGQRSRRRLGRSGKGGDLQLPQTFPGNQPYAPLPAVVGGEFADLRGETAYTRDRAY